MMTARNQFRKSQGVVPFGVGAIVDFLDESLMPAGLDVWPYEMVKSGQVDIRNSTQILDQRLQRRLTAEFNREISYFLSPTEAPVLYRQGQTRFDPSHHLMPFVRFPNWNFCPRCRTLWEVPWNTRSDDKLLKCRSTIRLNQGKAKVCNELPNPRKQSLIPVRFVVACASGHISDFPWREWAHWRGNSSCNAGSGKLFLISTGAAGLAGLKVVCSQCKSQNTLSSAYTQNAFQHIWPDGCPGDRPWLGPRAGEPGCSEEPKTIQRGASNAYFARTHSSILIPPYSEHIRRILDNPKVWKYIEALPDHNGQPPKKALVPYAEDHGIDPDRFYNAVIEKKESENTDSGDPESEEQYRFAEYSAFTGDRPPQQERDDFDIMSQQINDYSEEFQNFFEKIVLVPKLRETRALTGFSRVEPPETAPNLAELSLHPKKWLPAIEVRGEGIFLVLNTKSVDMWERQFSEHLTSRAEALHSRLGGSAPPVNARLLLLHTFAHLLIRQLVFDCGYDSSSLRERLYVNREESQEMLGLLIYTASGDAEGTLGGLVRQGKAGRLEPTVKAAIKNAQFCSSDPLCSESEGQGIHGLNLAACHACTLLPETSCEFGNSLLDRVTVIGSIKNSDTGYFSELNLEKL